MKWPPVKTLDDWDEDAIRTAGGIKCDIETKIQLLKKISPL